jgi:hypothetical protein
MSFVPSGRFDKQNLEHPRYPLIAKTEGLRVTGPAKSVLVTTNPLSGKQEDLAVECCNIDPKKDGLDHDSWLNPRRC